VKQRTIAVAPRTDVAEKRPARGVARKLPRFAELSVVSLRHSVGVNGRTLPAGTKGTIVAAYGDGVGYEVEVFEPFHAVVTLEAADLMG
jgi:hypothetical protein